MKFNRVQNFFHRWLNYLTTALLQHRWLLFVLLSASAIIFEIFEHQHVDNPVDFHFVREVVFFGFLYPLGVFLLLGALLNAQQEKNFLLRQKEIEQELNRELGSASNWKDLCKKITSFPASISPVVGVNLYSFSENNNVLNMEADWWLAKPKQISEQITTIPFDFCGVNNHTQRQHLHPFLVSKYTFKPSLKEYCLPLFNNNRCLGSLHLFIPAAEQFSTDQISFLNHISPAITQSLETAILQNQAALHTLTIKDERERIARQLHDTLGQNLAYLRLKLDQLSMESTLDEIALVQQDLARMRDIAHESHEQIRQTLISLHPEDQTNLNELLMTQVQAIANQSGFVLNASCTGDIVSIPTIVKHKIRAIFREALFNVQRHARANKVKFSICWDKPGDSLTIALADDGVDFDLDQTQDHGHIGLLIMQQRAEEIEANLTIHSSPGKGTLVELTYLLELG